MKDFNKLISIGLGALFLLVSTAVKAQEENFDNEKEKQKKEVIERNMGEYEFDPDGIAKKGRLKKLGKKAYKLEDYYTCIDYLEKYMELRPEDWKRAWYLAESYRNTRNYKDAEDWYTKIAANKVSKYPKALFYQAITQKNSGYFDEVETLMKDFKKQYKGSDAKFFKKRAKSETEGAIAATSIIDNPKKIVVSPLHKSINRETMESAPIILNNKEIVYSSVNADMEDLYSRSGPDRPARKLFKAKLNGYNWEKTGELDGPFNDENYNVSNGAFSYDGLRFYYSKCPKQIKKKDKCAIYMSEFRDGEWQRPEKLPEAVNQEVFNSIMPAVGFVNDKKTGEPKDVLYFVSDREKSRGGYDIWYSVFDIKKGGYVKYKNAGSKVNSAGDDLSPYYDVEFGTLYFSSNGHPNIGGFDIFKSEGSPIDKFGSSENMGTPINSLADDLFFTVSKMHDQGFMVSNRTGSNSPLNPNCCDDIYHFIYSEFIKIGFQGIAFEINDTVVDYTGNNQLGKATASLVTMDANGSDTLTLKQVETSGYESFFFDLQHGKDYMIKIEKKGYATRYFPVSTHEVTHSDTLVDKIGVKRIPPVEIEVPKVYFGMNKASISKEMKTNLVENLVPLFEEFRDLKLVIHGHTDDLGTSRFNDKLAVKRCEAVQRFLVENGVDEERVSVEPHGKSLPAVTLADNGNIEYVRSRNRRVEFEIMGEENFIITNNQE